MQDLIESIRLAVAPEATDELRATGATACLAILRALEANPGESLAMAPPPVPMPDAVATVVTALRGVPPEQLLDLAIARLRTALPPGQPAPTVQPLKFQLIPIPRRG
jgi:hypothetical protein